ncbi:MAG TPA: glycosyltransferase family 87 protein [Gemmatimonadota bacterium]|nr:glycosyltransferase family 87 protein [Gemmatimonadota bacterium]
MRSSLVRVAEISALGALPLIALVIGLSTFAGQNRLALDFHHELYPQAELVGDGDDPYPAPDADLSDGTNTIWPIAAVLPVVPLTFLSPSAADWIATGIVLASLVAALWVLGIRDWRIYGVTLLWSPVIDAYQTANATLPLALLVALTWRYRDRRFVAGASLGVALAAKFFLWPVAVWLVATGRRWAAAISLAVGAASLLLLVPFIGLLDYARLIRNLSDTFDGFSYTPYALLVELGTPSGVARVLTFLFGAAILALAWRRRSLGLAIGAALVFSPIVWRHFFALLVIPLAIARPRFDLAWLIPVAFWLVPGTYNGDTWQTAIALAAAAATLVLCERVPRQRDVRVLAPDPARA